MRLTGWLTFVVHFSTLQCELVGAVLISRDVPELVCPVFLTGPLRAVAVLLLVGLTWLLANTLFGGESGSSVRHFFTGERSSSETINRWIENELRTIYQKKANIHWS